MSRMAIIQALILLNKHFRESYILSKSVPYENWRDYKNSYIIDIKNLQIKNY